VHQTKKSRAQRAYQLRIGKDEAAHKSALRRWILLSIGALCILVVLTYGNSLGNDYVWDDHEQIVMNPGLRAGASWTALFSSDVWGHRHRGQAATTNYYRPLQMVSYRAVREFGSDARTLHLLSVSLGLLAVMAAYWVYLQLSRGLGIAFAAAALFAVHPVHSEAVDWISALPEIGCTASALLAFGCFLAMRREQTKTIQSRSVRRYWVLWCLALLCFAVALLWKETAVVVPPIVAIYVFCVEPGSVGQRMRSALKLSLSFWCVLAGYLLLRFQVLGYLAVQQRIWDLTPTQASLNALYLLALYWWKLAVPAYLSAYYVFSPIRSLFDARAIAGVLFVALSCVAVGNGLRRNKLAAFAAMFVFITLLPVMNIYGLGRNVFAERYLYLPSFGFCLLVVLLADGAVRRLPVRARKAAGAVKLAALVLVYCWIVIARNPDWHDDATLFRATLVRSPNAPFVHYMVAATAGDDSREAEAHYQTAIELAVGENPPDVLDLTRSYEGLASLYADRGEYSRSLELLQRWRAVAPDRSAVDAEEGLLLLRAGSWQEAEPLLNRAFAARPNDENVLNALGLLAWEHQHDLRQAVGFFSQALAIHTSEDDFRASLYNNLGGAYGDGRQFAMAIPQFESAVRIAPANPEYRTNLATAMAAAGRRNDAVSQANLVLSAHPNYAPARDLLADLLGGEKP
jgi:tetratricopeptide (TPR) repeat protein